MANTLLKSGFESRPIRAASPIWNGGSRISLRSEGVAMSVEDKPLDDVTEADLDALVVAGSPERRVRDYKAALPGGTDSERKEFLFDVSSFANAAGGHLI